MRLSYAEFARAKGEERASRRKRAAQIAGGVAGGGALGAGARYGIPEVRSRLAGSRVGQMMPLDKVMLEGGSRSARGLKAATSGGGMGVLDRDIKTVKKAVSSARSRAGALAGSKTGQRILGTTKTGRALRGAGALGAGAAGAAAVLSYLKNRKKKDEPQGIVARGRKAASRLTNR